MNMRLRFVTTSVVIFVVIAAGYIFGFIPHLVPRIGTNDVSFPLNQAPIGMADFIRVDKSDRKLELLRDNEIIATYQIALGRNSLGHKQQEGDKRTPEGLYTIDWRNPKSGYFLSLHISYPDLNDIALAQNAGFTPGGNVMIHGQPNGYDVAGNALQSFDWTYGCIAVTNQAMQQIWNAVPDGTPIEILP
jgi:murein L,D-transpeptidase YafK